jgi:hypothetical protein
MHRLRRWHKQRLDEQVYLVSLVVEEEASQKQND